MKPIFKNSLNIDEINHNLQVICDELNKKEPYYKMVESEGIGNSATLHRIVFDKDRQQCFVPIEFWGKSYSTYDYEAVVLNFGAYGKQRVHFKNFNRIFTLIDKIHKHVKREWNEKLFDKIDCDDQLNKKYKRLVDSWITTLQYLGLDIDYHKERLSGLHGFCYLKSKSPSKVQDVFVYQLGEDYNSRTFVDNFKIGAKFTISDKRLIKQLLENEDISVSANFKIEALQPNVKEVIHKVLGDELTV